MKMLWILIMLPSLVQASFFNEHEQGWFWYQDPKKKAKEDSINVVAPNATEQMNALRKAVEDSANLAILYPTEEN